MNMEVMNMVFDHVVSCSLMTSRLEKRRGEGRGEDVGVALLLVGGVASRLREVAGEGADLRRGDMTFGDMTFGDITFGELTFGDMMFGDMFFGE